MISSVFLVLVRGRGLVRRTETCEVVALQQILSVDHASGKIPNIKTRKCVHTISVSADRQQRDIVRNQRRVVIHKKICEGVGVGAFVP